jgi:hypothetical protein
MHAEMALDPGAPAGFHFAQPVAQKFKAVPDQRRQDTAGSMPAEIFQFGEDETLAFSVGAHEFAEQFCFAAMEDADVEIAPELLQPSVRVLMIDASLG